MSPVSSSEAQASIVLPVTALAFFVTGAESALPANLQLREGPAFRSATYRETERG